MLNIVTVHRKVRRYTYFSRRKDDIQLNLCDEIGIVRAGTARVLAQALRVNISIRSPETSNIYNRTYLSRQN